MGCVLIEVDLPSGGCYACLSLMIDTDIITYLMVLTRAITANDIERLCDIWHEQDLIEAQLDPASSVLHIPRDEKARQLSTALADADRNMVWGATRDEQIIGFIHCRAVHNHGCVVTIAVDAHQAGGGIGTALLDVAQTWFQERDVRAYTATVPRNVAVQQAFWRAKGGRVVAETVVMRVDES